MYRVITKTIKYDRDSLCAILSYLQVKEKAGQKYGTAAAAKRNYHASAWDDHIPDAEYFNELFRVRWEINVAY